MNRRTLGLITGSLATLALNIGVVKAQDQLTLCWAAWDPANALIELSKDFASEIRPQHELRVRAVAELRGSDAERAELGRPVVRSDDRRQPVDRWRLPRTVTTSSSTTSSMPTASTWMTSFPRPSLGYAEWPKNTPNYWALPAFGDVVGWTYRKDWFERPELQAEFKEKYGRDLGVPALLDELKDIAEFFQGRDIDGKTVYGAAIYTERGSEGITMGVTNALYNYGFQYENPDKPYDLEGFVNSDGAIAGLEFYKRALRHGTPPGSSNWYMGENIDAYKSGQVAHADELCLHLAGCRSRSERRRRQVRLLP